MQTVQTEVAPDTGARAFSAGTALGAAARAWWRNLWPLTGTMVLLTLPSLVLDLAWPRDPRTGMARLLVVLLVGVGSALVAATALAAGGLEALRGGRPKMVPLVFRGLASAWRMLRVSVRAFPWGTGAALVFVSMVILAKTGTVPPRSFAGFTMAAALMVALLVLLFTAPLCWVRVFPLPAVLLEESERTDAELVQRARELTQGHRWRVLLLFLVGILFTALILFVDLPNVRLGVPTHRVAHTIVMLVDAFGWGFVQMLPSAAYVALSGEHDVDQLASVFN